MKVKAIHTRIFKEGENLQRFIIEHIPTLKDESVLVVTSKIVALAERRTAPLKDKDRIIRKESTWIIPTKYVPLTITNGMLMTSAGIDESNAKDKIILLPKDSYATAKKLHKLLCKHYNIKNFGILITDSRTLPLRAGTIGVALGYVGFRGVKNYKGVLDIFGRALKITVANIADSLASTSVLLMGEGDEQKPLAVIEKAPIEFADRTDSKELIIKPEEDLYFNLLKRSKRTK